MTQNISDVVGLLYRVFGRSGNRAWIFALTALLAVSGCRADDDPVVNSEPTPASEKTERTYGEQLQGIVDGLNEQVGKATGSLPAPADVQKQTSEEVQKLFRWEYKVVEMPKGASAGRMEAELVILGQDGWECFAVTEHESEMRLTCKRRPKSVLNYMKYVPFL